MLLSLGFSDRLPVAALVVSSSEDDHHALRDIFSQHKWKLDSVGSIAEAVGWIERWGPPSIVISKRVLLDGDWRMLLNRLTVLPRLPRLIVSSRLVDNALWSEVLNSLGFDVLTIPFSDREVTSVVSSAWASWQRQWNGMLNGPEVHVVHLRALGEPRRRESEGW